MNIPLTKPWLDGEEEEAVLAVLRSGWLTQGKQVELFEVLVAERLGAAHAVATTSCTTALQLSVIAMDIRPGDEVIVPAFTWVATANSVVLAGGTPVFCDIEPDTYALNAAMIERLISKKTVGIIPVHPFGLPADIECVMQIAKRYGLWVVEDAACAVGATYDGKHVGTFGRTGCFSFHPRKIVTTGEGGMIITSDATLAMRCRMLRNHGASVSAYEREQKKSQDDGHPIIGTNARMTDIQAAIGCMQIHKLSAILERRLSMAKHYHESLKDIPWLQTPTTPKGRTHTFQSYVCKLTETKNAHVQQGNLMRYLHGQGVASVPGTHVPPALDAYKSRHSNAAKDFPEASLAMQSTFTLPLYPTMAEEEQEYVIRALRTWKEKP